MERPAMGSFATIRVACALALAGILSAACGGGHDAGLAAPATPVLTTLTVALSPATIQVGQTAMASVTGADQHGNAMAVGTVTWSAASSAIATVSASGVVTGLAMGQTQIIASAAGKQGQQSLTVTIPAATIYTGITWAAIFMDHCPTTDPAYATLRQDFEIRIDGQPDATPVTCTEPYSVMPIAQLTDELIAWQTLRTAYYMSFGTDGKLPWTPLSFYAWLKANIAGVNLRSATGIADCCAVINGKKYIEYSRQDSATRNVMRDWPWISAKVEFYAHETRHAEPAVYPHVTGCPAFPSATGPAGCDANYDLSNLGAYGIQYWLEANWATGTIDVGIGCSTSTVAHQYATWHAGNANSETTRFVSNAPPQVQPVPPWGGPCPAP